MFFQLSEIDKHWEEIQKLLSPDKFVEKHILNESVTKYVKNENFSYSDLKLPKSITPKKQATQRHLGVHGYFTRQSLDILQHYITHFTKRQNPFSVLAGQLIINFIKKETPKAIQKFKLCNDIYDLIIETIESVIAKNEGAVLEQINDELIIKGLEFGFLDVLSREYKDLTPILISEFDYKQETKKFYIRQNQRFKTKIPLDMRIRYFLISYLKRKEFENINPTTDDIILDIMPLLKNGLTPENQTILKILESIADEFGKNNWRLKKEGQLSFELI